MKKQQLKRMKEISNNILTEIKLSNVDKFTPTTIHDVNELAELALAAAKEIKKLREERDEILEIGNRMLTKLQILDKLI